MPGSESSTGLTDKNNTEDNIAIQKLITEI